MDKMNNKRVLTTQSPLLLQMLERIEPINFTTIISNGDQNDLRKPTFKELIVSIVDEVVNVAMKNEWGLCKMNGFIYAYTGQYWQLIDADEFKCFLGDAAVAMGLKRTEGKFYVFQDQLYKQFIASARLGQEKEVTDATFINLKNGTYEITEKGNILREFRKEDALTYQLPFCFNQESTAPVFQEYLDRVLPDKELQHILAEYIGYIFAKGLKLEKCLLLYGTGANGKSVFFDIINALLGKNNISNFSLGNLSEEHNRALISNKLLNYGSEIRGSIDSEIFKLMVSGEPVQCRLKYGNSFTITDYARLCFNCNELPKEVEFTEAFFRRFLIVPFNVTIPEDERDPELAKEIIGTELSGIFNWVLEGLNRLLFNTGFTYSDVVKKVVSTYKQESDNVYQFIEDAGYKKSEAAYITLGTVYAYYRSFCQNDGYRPLSKSKFHKRLNNIGFLTHRLNKGIVVYAQINQV